MTDAQRAWLELKFGMFVSFGINTFYGMEWSDGTLSPDRFNPREFDARQWVAAAQSAGMKYLLLIAKHHDGFCNWPTRLTNYSVLASPWKRDVVGEVAAACRESGLKLALYYSLWDCHEPSYRDDGRYAEFVMGQLRELLTQYGPVVQLWFDGTWDKMHPAEAIVENKLAIYRTSEAAVIDQWERVGERRWRWREIYARIKELQSDCLVLNNSCTTKPGVVVHWPVDLRNSEQIQRDSQGKVVQPKLVTTYRRDGREYFLPMESSACIRECWFFNATDRKFQTPEQIVEWLQLAQDRGGNFLVNAAPDDRGVIPAEELAILKKVGELLK